MSNPKLWIASENGRARLPPDERTVAGAKPAATPILAKPEEGVRLIRAFSRISDPSLRAQLIALAEKMARM